MTIDRPNWNGSGATLPAVVEEGGDERPTFSQEDLALLEPGPGGDDLDATVAKSIKSGVFSREEAQAHYGYTDDEMDRALAPPVSLASVQRELGQIDRLRRTDKPAYLRDETLQERERQLIALHEKLKAQSAPAIQDGAYDGSGLEPDLLAQWERQGGVGFHLKVAQTAARHALDALEPEEAEALTSSFAALPANAQSSIFGFLAVEPGRWRAATDDDLQQFAESDVGDLVEEWGGPHQAAKKLGVVRGRIDLILSAMTPADRAKGEAWLEGLPREQARAVLLALSGGK